RTGGSSATAAAARTSVGRFTTKQIAPWSPCSQSNTTERAKCGSRSWGMARSMTGASERSPMGRWSPGVAYLSSGRREELPDHLGEPRGPLPHRQVAAAGQLDEAGARDRARERAAVRDRDQRVVAAVHDERRRRDVGDRGGPVAREDRGHLAGEG